MTNELKPFSLLSYNFIPATISLFQTSANIACSLNIEGHCDVSLTLNLLRELSLALSCMDLTNHGAYRFTGGRAESENLSTISVLSEVQHCHYFNF